MADAGRRQGRIARLGRRLALGRNPLRRRTDRVEAAVLALMLLALAASAVAGALVGSRVMAAGMRQVRHDRTTDRQVTAVLRTDARDDSSATANGAAPATAPALARWSSGGTSHQGNVWVAAGLTRGTRVRIWVDGQGRATGAPATRSQAVCDAVAAGLLVPAGLAALLVALWYPIRWRFDRARKAAWARDWARVGPLWSPGRR